MKTNERALLAACIDTGIYAGWTRAHKHDDAPPELRIQEEIDNAIWYEIDQYFVFESERDLCDEVVEGFDELETMPREGEIRAVNYPIRTAEDGQLVFKHRLEQYYSGEWREISVYQEDEEGKLSARETDRLRAKKKQIYEDLKDAVDREWVGQSDQEKLKKLCEALDSAEEKAKKKRNQRKYKW